MTVQYIPPRQRFSPRRSLGRAKVTGTTLAERQSLLAAGYPNRLHPRRWSWPGDARCVRLGAKRHFARSPDKAVRPATETRDPDRHVVGFARERLLLNRQICRHRGQSVERDHLSFPLERFAPEVKGGRLPQVERIVRGFTHRGRDDSAPTIQNAQEILAARHLFAIGSQALPNRSRDWNGYTRRSELGISLFLVGEIASQLRETHVALFDLGADIGDQLCDFIETLRGARNIVIAVADEQAGARRIKLHLRSPQAMAQRLGCADGDVVVAAGAYQCRFRLIAGSVELLRPVERALGVHCARVSRCDLGGEL